MKMNNQGEPFLYWQICQ